MTMTTIEKDEAAKVGMMATVCLGSDRLVYEVVAVSKKGFHATLRRCDRKALHEGMTDSGQKWEITPNLAGEIRKAYRDIRGTWRISGAHYQYVKMNHSSEYLDYSF